MTSQKKHLNAKQKFTLLTIASIIILLSLSGYWLKSQLGINFSRGVSLSRHFPFNALVPSKVIYNPRPGILLQDSFDSFSLFSNWKYLWMREEGGVTKKKDFQGIDNSRCLLVNNNSPGSWSIAHKKYIQVKEGDIFAFTVSVRLHGENISAYAGVAAFDKRKKAISWNFFTEKTERTVGWVFLKKTFTIPSGIAYIQFRLSGSGAGTYRFDDVRFVKNF